MTPRMKAGLAAWTVIVVVFFVAMHKSESQRPQTVSAVANPVKHKFTSPLEEQLHILTYASMLLEEVKGVKGAPVRTSSPQYSEPLDVPVHVLKRPRPTVEEVKRILKPDWLTIGEQQCLAGTGLRWYQADHADAERAYEIFSACFGSDGRLSSISVNWDMEPYTTGPGHYHEDIGRSTNQWTAHR
jgi:hypothetical protein